MMHPYSVSQKHLYNLALKECDYFSDFYVYTNHTFEDLAKIISVKWNRLKNTIIITGYKGCGKSNFIGLIEGISKGNISQLNMKTLRDTETNSEIEKIKVSGNVSNMIN